MKTIRTETAIKASPETVWKILMDFEGYPAWNSFIKRISGRKAIGELLTVTVQPARRKPMTFRPTVVKVGPGRSFRWRGNFISGVLFSGEHGLAVEESEDGGARFVHDEVFRGLLVPVASKMLEATHEAFANMNAAVKQRAEESEDATTRSPAAAEV